MSIGEDRVRASFNPSSDSAVDELKRLTADLINKCHARKNDSGVGGEEARLWSLAMTAYEEACLWAVKACTTQK